MRRSLIFLLRAYQNLISPYTVVCCRYQPTCSNYAIEAIDTYGLVKGGALSLKRILCCHPGSKGGYDPVPLITSPRCKH